MTVIEIPGSKSITARGLFLAAAAHGRTELKEPLTADDTEGFAEGLSTLGYQVHREPNNWTIVGRPAGPGVSHADVFCRDGATTARFLPALAATGHGVFRFDASNQMRARPLGPLTQALAQLGVDISFEAKNGHHPFVIRADGIKGGSIALDAGLSSQFLTALLLVGPLTMNGLEVAVTDLVSVPYVEITLAMMRHWGVDARRDGNTFLVPAHPYEACDYQVEPDASTASYVFAASAVMGQSVTVPGIGVNALQGDLRFVEVLKAMGASVQIGENSVTVTGAMNGHLSGVTINMRDISDTMPTLAAIAPFADGPVRIEDVYNTRIKECDRLEVCVENLQAMGVPVSAGRDWIQIDPAEPHATQIACHRDHRIAMAFSVAGLRVPGLTLDDPLCVKKTFPEFHNVLNRLCRSWGLSCPNGHR